MTKPKINDTKQSMSKFDSINWNQLDINLSESVLRIMGDIVFVLNYDFEIEQVCGYDEELIELVKSLNYHKTRLDHFILFKDSLDNLRQLIFDSFTNESEDFVCNKLNLYLVNQTQEFSVCVVNDYDNRGLLQIIVVCKQLEVSSLSPGYPPFHAAIDVSVDGMALIDENWNLVYCNKSLETFLNSNKNDIISKALSSFFKPGFFKKTFPRLKKYLTKNHFWKGRIPLQIDYNKLEIFSISITKTKDNNFFLVVRDNNNNKLREEKNRKRFSNYKKFLNQSPGLFFKMVYNPIERLFSIPVIQGYEKDSLLSQILPSVKRNPKEIYKYIHPHDRNRLKKIIRYSVVALKPFSEEIRFVSITGDYYWRELSGIPELTDNDEIVFHGSIHDINNNKIYQSNLISIEKDKLDLLDLTIKQNHKIHQFSQIVSHNIRNHSANISILLKLLEEEENEIDFKKHMSYLVQSSLHLSETTELLNKILNQDIHTFSNIITIPIRNTFEKILDNINPGLLEVESHINLDIPEDLTINGIKNYVENILHHLLTNSIRYRSTNRTLRIQISYRIDTDFTIIYIHDNGIGIDLERNKNKIFQMYKVFNNQTDAKGLGLFISKAQMELMNGKIEVSSELDKGTVFSMYFKN